MKSLLFYILQVSISSGVLYGYYHIILRENKFHQYNRFYLLSATMMSILVPFISIPIYYNHEANTSSIIYQTLSVISTHDTESFTLNSNNIENHFTFYTWQNLLITFYTLIACFILTKFFIALYKINHLLKRYPAKKLENIHFIETAEPGTPFSFFKWLFWNNKICLTSKEGVQIFRHELFHIQQKHSWDIIFLELLTIVFWINPFIHLMKKELKAIHEFLADEFAMKDSQDGNYAELLLMQALGTQNNRLSNPFFHNQIKRRISMITSSKHSSFQYLRKVMVIPIAVILLAIFAFKIQNKENRSGNLITQSPITVVIDPGHGGKDAGVSLNGIHEKDLCLAIAKKIKSLNTDENIHLLFTRMGDSTTSPQEDAAFADRNKADLLIALHINAIELPNTDVSKKGIEVYVSSRKKEDYKSEVLATSLINELQNTYDINRYVLKKQSGIWILDSPKCPAALIEIGYITNPEDFKFITDDENQDKIAKDILTAIQKYAIVRAEGIIEENEPIKFEIEKQTGKNILTYHGNVIKEISLNESKSQLILISDSGLWVLSKEKSESILKQNWNQIKYLYVPINDINKHGNGYEINQSDSIPVNSKIKKEDINEINVRNGLIIIKLKNGDSILAVQNDYRERERENQLVMEHLLQSKQSAMKENQLMQMLEERQRENESQNAEFERIMMQKKEQNEMRQEELQKMLKMKQNEIPSEKQEEFQRMLEMKKRDFYQHEMELKGMLEDRQHQAEMQNEEFRKILEAKNHQYELQEENRKMMEINKENEKKMKKRKS